MPTTAAILSLEGLTEQGSTVRHGRPAALTHVAGVPLVTRQILTLGQSGVSKFYLVPGKLESSLRALIDRDGRLGKLGIEVISGEAGPALAEAVRKAAGIGGAERVLLAGGDALFGAGAARILQNGLLPGAIQSWKPGAEVYYADARALAAKGGALAAALQGASSLDPASHPAGSDNFVERIRKPSDVRRAKRAIFATVTKPTSGWVSKNVNAKLSIPLSKFLSDFPVTPNMMTFVATVVGVACAPLLARADYLGVFLGGLCFQLASALDRCDGELARSKFLASEYGEWIDTIGDNLTYAAFVVGLTLGMHRHTGAPFVLYLGFGLLGLLLALLGVMYSYLLKNTKSGSLVAVYKDMEAKYEGRRKPVLYSLLDNIRFMGKRDFFSLAVFVVCAFNQLAFLFWGAVFALSAMFIYILSGKMSLPGEKAPA